MADQNPHQPQALVGNQFSDIYFAALRQRAMGGAPVCAHCGAQLTGKTRMSDGTTSWCDASHQALWIQGRARNTKRLELVQQGWSPERWAAVNERR